MDYNMGSLIKFQITLGGNLVEAIVLIPFSAIDPVSCLLQVDEEDLSFKACSSPGLYRVLQLSPLLLGSKQCYIGIRYWQAILIDHANF